MSTRPGADPTDAADQVVKITQPDNTFSTTDYNNDGTVADTIDALNAKTVYTYDGQGRLTSTKDPDNRTTSSTIDPAGLLTTAVDATGRTTTLTHDPAGRVTKISYSDGTTPTVTIGYDADGRQTAMTDGTGASSWTYDAFGQLTSAVTPGGTVGYGYDPVGNTTSISYPGQTTPVARGFDAADRLTSVKDFAGNSTTFGYDHDSAIATTSYPGGSVVTNTYNPAEQQTGTTAAKSGTTLAAYTYGRDNAGQVNSQTIAGTTQTFTYSPREQLATGVTGGTTTGYAYDAANHPTQVGSTTATFDPAGQECWSTTSAVTTPTCAGKPAGATSYTFNGNGQRTATTPSTGTASTYSYDQAGRLTTATTPTGTGTYTYNGLGQRSSKTVAGATTSYIWDNNTVPNLLVDGTTRYLYGPDQLPIEQTSTAGTSYFVHDQIGSTRTLLSTTGTVAGGYTYTPYGAPTHTGTATTNLQFSGQYTDPETGLDYLRARYYDPTTAQFLTIDPQLASTGTPYAYVAGNPLNHTDPTGQDCGFWCWAGIGAAAVGAIALAAVSFGTAVPAEAAVAGGIAAEEGGEAALAGIAASDAAAGAAESDGAIEGCFEVSASEPQQQAALDYATSSAKLDHIFAAKHNFDPLVQQFGSREAVVKQMLDGLDGQTPLEGQFQQTIVVGGQQVVVRGAVVDGVTKIGTAFTP